MSFNGVTRPGSPPPTLLTPPSTTASLAGGGGCACPRASRVAAPVKKTGGARSRIVNASADPGRAASEGMGGGELV
eukprot:CAMPEP_0172084690 /NCGR_PEP_ID=MMETSP1043-20130122/21133_1 /TAXON_ID=464988 /ORGANISM="Hemiselmis andersenii, Strain CCMP441" /LENGTH=75 /DNA_ID=CAMNT_0012746541 /DNA_START=18 /DNA_END=242 /DNA_ORIENTATION=+